MTTDMQYCVGSGDLSLCPHALHSKHMASSLPTEPSPYSMNALFVYPGKQLGVLKRLWMSHVPFLFPSLEGVCLWYSYGMAALLQQVVLLRSVDCERPAAVHWLALCAGLARLSGSRAGEEVRPRWLRLHSTSPPSWQPTGLDLPRARALGAASCQRCQEATAARPQGCCCY